MEERGRCKATHVEGPDDPLQRDAHEHHKEPARKDSKGLSDSLRLEKNARISPSASSFCSAGLRQVPSEAFSVLAVDERLAQKTGPAEGAASKEEVEKEIWGLVWSVWFEQRDGSMRCGLWKMLNLHLEVSAQKTIENQSIQRRSRGKLPDTAAVYCCLSGYGLFFYIGTTSGSTV